MADAIEINPAVGGSAGKKVVVGTATLDGGEAVIETPLSHVDYVLITQKSATSSGGKYAWDPTGLGNFEIHDNGGGSDSVSFVAIGF